MERRNFFAVAAYTILTALIVYVSYIVMQDGKTNLYYSQRASVVLNTLEPVPLVANGVLIGYLVIPQWTNVGNTNATDLTYFDNFQFSTDDLANGFAVSQGGAHTEGPTSLGPKEIMTTGAFRDSNGTPFIFPHSCFQDLALGKFKYAYIWGVAQYHDVLKPEEKRVTRYCWRLYGTINVKGEKLNSITTFATKGIAKMAHATNTNACTHPKCRAKHSANL